MLTKSTRQNWQQGESAQESLVLKGSTGAKMGNTAEKFCFKCSDVSRTLEMSYLVCSSHWRAVSEIAQPGWSQVNKGERSPTTLPVSLT